MAREYGNYTWDDYNLYRAAPGDSWDDIATLAYGDPMLCSLLLDANPEICGRAQLEGGETVVIPIIDLAHSKLTPPWRN